VAAVAVHRDQLCAAITVDIDRTRSLREDASRECIFNKRDIAETERARAQITNRALTARGADSLEVQPIGLESHDVAGDSVSTEVSDGKAIRLKVIALQLRGNRTWLSIFGREVDNVEERAKEQ